MLLSLSSEEAPTAARRWDPRAAVPSALALQPTRNAATSTHRGSRCPSCPRHGRIIKCHCPAASITLHSPNKQLLSPANLIKSSCNKDETQLPLNIFKTSKQATQKTTKETCPGGLGAPTHPRLPRSGRRGDEYAEAIS